VFEDPQESFHDEIWPDGLETEVQGFDFDDIVRENEEEVPKLTPENRNLFDNPRSDVETIPNPFLKSAVMESDEREEVIDVHKLIETQGPNFLVIFLCFFMVDFSVHIFTFIYRSISSFFQAHRFVGGTVTILDFTRE
jgi:hypothetical protein